MRIGLMGRFGPGGSGAIAYDAAASALFARFTTDPGKMRKRDINALIVGLKTDGLWAKLDALYLPAAHDAQAAQRNWKSDTFNLSPVSSPVFTADRGYKGDGATSYLTTGYNPATAGGVFVQDSAHLGVYANTDDISTSGILGNTNVTVIPRNGSSLTTRMNATGGVSGTLSPVTTIGHSLVTRTISTNTRVYRNGVELIDAANTSAAVVSELMDLLRRRQTSSTYHPARVAAAHWGSGLTAGEAAAISNRITTFLAAIGAN